MSVSTVVRPCVPARPEPKGIGAESPPTGASQLSAATRRHVAHWCTRVRGLLGRRLAWLGGALLAAHGLGGAGYIHAKAGFAQLLLGAAWDRTLAHGARSRPWPWADHWPVAVLDVPRLAQRQYVLAGASGRTLAFGPALSTGARMPGEPGRVVVSGHRDTHFAFLRELRAGDRVWLEDGRGRHAYEVIRFEVADARTMRLLIDSDEPRLALVTCYPFDALTPGGPLRYVVEARLVATAFTPG